jgi:hypothetical protein
MKYVILFLMFLMSNYFAQTQTPDLIITIAVSFENPPYPPPYPGVEYIELGLDSTATDSIDVHLGEGGLPPIPPPGYPAVFILPFSGPPIVVQRDIRFGELPYTGVKVHDIGFYSEGGATIHWALPNGAAGQLTDNITGNIINEPMNGTGSYYVSNLSIGRLRITMTYDNITPVELLSFTASITGSAVQLNWITATETNNSGFEIERKAPSKSPPKRETLGWKKIGFVQGFGTTTEIKNYSFTDNDVTTGVYKYRLKQIDFDGTFEYSYEIEIEVDFTPKEFMLYQNYPNPFNPVTLIKWQQPMQSQVLIKVYDILGNEIAVLVNEIKPAGNYSVNFDASGFASGVYFYSITAGGFRQTKKMIVTK